MREGGGTFRAKNGREFVCQASDDWLAPNFHLIGDDCAFLVALWFDFRYRKASTTQIWQGTLQSIMQVILEGWSLLGRREHPIINAINLAMPIVGTQHQLNLFRSCRHTHLRLVVKPTSRREQHQN